jgi:hypothetical protein
MILLVHLLFGAAIGHIIKNPLIAVVFAFLGHYFLDLFPHIEYPIGNIQNKQWRKSIPDFLKVTIDFLIGITIIYFFSKNEPIVYVCAFFAILPDGLTLLSFVFQNKLLKMQADFHRGKIHFLRDKKVSIFWRNFIQIAIAVISILLIKL